MNGPRDERAQSQGGSATDDQDWYLADTYAQDPHATDPYATAARPGPYDRTADEPAPPAAADTTPAPESEDEPVLALAGEPGVPASRWARDAVTPPPPAGSPWDTETTEYVGVDSLLGAAEPAAPPSGRSSR